MELNIPKLKKQISEYLGVREFHMEKIPHGASVRRYYRLRFNDRKLFPARTVVLMQVPLERLEIAEDYLSISHYLKRHGIPQPGIYKIDLDKGWIFLEHGHGTTLDLFFQKNLHCMKEQIYQQLLDFLISLQEKASYESGCPAFSRRFDHDKYSFEFGFHVREQLLKNYYNHELTTSEERLFINFSNEISRYLDLDMQIFVHRDFQSSNIFYQNGSNGTHFQIIDFQDARSGHPLYDMVSLLWDSYVTIPQALLENLYRYFYNNHRFIRQQFSEEEYLRHIDYLIIQRKLHDAGAFVYTYFLTENDHYIPYINGAVNMALTRIQKYPEWGNITEIFKTILADKHV